MGRAKRLLKEAIRAGTIDPASLKMGPNYGTNGLQKKGQMLFCKACRTLCSQFTARKHIRECWGKVDPQYKNFANTEPIPNDCPPHIIAARRKELGLK